METKVGSFAVKKGLAQMLKGGVIMDVVTPEHAKIAEDAVLNTIHIKAEIEESATLTSGSTAKSAVPLSTASRSAMYKSRSMGSRSAL